ncbi:rCG22212, partial [Rattus norvegicus]
MSRGHPQGTCAHTGVAG